MDQKIVTEQHYIIIGSNRYQIVFDARRYKHDILIRGLFHWNTTEDGRVAKIDFILDNLNSIPVPYIITKAIWCPDQKRIELHIDKKSGAVLRTQTPLEIPNGFPLEKHKEMEIVLRYSEGSQPIPTCEKFSIPRPNEDLFEDDYLNEFVQADKDGAILIGTTIIKN